MKNRITTAMIVVSALFFGGIQIQAATLTVLDFPVSGDFNSNTRFNDIFEDYVVGSYASSPTRATNGLNSGLIYNRATNAWTAVNVDGARSTTLTGVHNGFAVGSYVSGPSGNLVTRGFVYEISTTTTALIDLPGDATNMTLTGVFGNRASGNYDSPTLGTTAFTYDFVFGGDYQNVDYTGDGSTTVGDIFGGMIVGNYSGGGFIYNFSTGTGSDINFPGSGNSTTLNGVSGDGSVAGSFNNSNGTFGFYYDGTNYNSLNFAGTNNTEAGGIYNELIVGNFLGVDGKVHGFIYDTAAIPEPSIATFLGGFGAMLLLRRRR